MSPYEVFFEILTAFIARLCGRMLLQRNNEKPSSSDINSPTFSESTNSKCDTSSSMLRQQNDKRPSSSYGNAPNISNIRDSQASNNQVASAVGATFSPSFAWSGPGSRSPEAQTQPDKKRNASQVDPANNSNAQQGARQGNTKSSPVPRQQNDESSSSYGDSPNISNVTDSQVSNNQVASAKDTNFSPSFTWSGPDSRSPEGQNQPDKKHNG